MLILFDANIRKLCYFCNHLITDIITFTCADYNRRYGVSLPTEGPEDSGMDETVVAGFPSSKNTSLCVMII